MEVVAVLSSVERECVRDDSEDFVWWGKNIFLFPAKNPALVHN